MGGISDFEDGGFYGFCEDLDQKKEKIQEELRKK